METPNVTSALPVARPALLDLESPITDDLIELFAVAKQGGRGPVVSASATLPANSPGIAGSALQVASVAPGEQPTLTDQGKDYRQKVRTFKTELARHTDEPLRIVDLTGERVNWVLQHRIDPHTVGRFANRRAMPIGASWARSLAGCTRPDA